jgi:hypothetical protein
MHWDLHSLLFLTLLNRLVERMEAIITNPTTRRTRLHSSLLKELGIFPERVMCMGLPLEPRSPAEGGREGKTTAREHHISGNQQMVYLHLSW